MSLTKFAKRYKLQEARNEYGEAIVPGKFGHIYIWAPYWFGAVLEGKTKATSRMRLEALCVPEPDVFDGKKHPVCVINGQTEALFKFRAGDRAFIRALIRHLALERTGKVGRWDSS